MKLGLNSGNPVSNHCIDITGYPFLCMFCISNQHKIICPAVRNDSRASLLLFTLDSHSLRLIRNLTHHLLNHLCQLLLALFPRLRIDISAAPLAVDTSGRVSTFPEVVIDLVDVAAWSYMMLVTWE